MRFLRLDLRAFGSFGDAPPIDLGGGDRGLHLIHGPNEAGKSTALRAIRRLLFGFRHVTRDNHVHKNEDLRIGATIRGEDGSELAFLRRKKEVRPLWTADDHGPLAPDALSPFLGGLDEEKFVDLFSMDHAELVAGGLAILKGGGRLGEMLFAAGSGLAPVAEVRKGLDEEIGELFKPGGKNPAINAALVALKEARDLAEQKMLGTQSWVNLDGRIARARARLVEIDEEYPRVEAERRRLERLRKALPLIARREESARELDQRRDVPVLPDGFADLRRAEEAALGLAAREARDASEALEGIGRDLAGLGPPDPVLAESEAIGQLQGELGVYLKESRERPAREAQLAYIEADARSRRSALLPPGAADADDLGAGGLRAIASGRGLILELGQQLAMLEASCAQAGAEVERRAGACPGLDDRPIDPGAPRLAGDLADLVARLARLGDLDGQLVDARSELAQAERQAAVGLRALPLWSGTLDELEALAVPPVATVDRFEADLRAASEAVARAEAALAQAEGDRQALEREIEGVRLAGPVPTEEELAALRRARDRGWRRVRDAWIAGGPAADDRPKLADDHEAGVRAADDLADRLRREADRVAAQAHREAARRALLDRLAALAEDRDRRARDRAGLLDDWAGSWRPLGIAPLPPREMRDWMMVNRAGLVGQAGEIRRARARVERAAEKVAGHRAEVGRGLARLGEPPAEPGESLGSLLDRARSAVARVEAGVKLAAARADREKAEATLAAWRSRWAAAVGPLGLGPDDSPGRANAALAGVDELIRAADEVVALRGSIAQGDRLAGRFESDLGALLGRLGAEAPAGGSEAAARAILARLDRARRDDALREGLARRQVDERARLARARGEVDRAGARLAALAREARCASPEGLADAERASEEVKALRARLRELDERLADLAEAAPVARLIRDAEGLDPESLAAEIATLADRLAPLQEERDQLGQEIGGCAEQLRRMNGGQDAADARQEVEERMARLADDVERYARLRLASAVLREAVERYRKEHQGPVLDRAGALFAGLTAGSFSGLRADVDEKGQPVLRGVRAGGSVLLDVEGMSEGTADQLYLALRLASLETYLDDHEPMPLVVDDVLVNFDNARALAALQALAALSRKTQVLVFTHHEHLVNLARSALAGDVLFVHRLGRAGPPSGPRDAPAAEVKPARKTKAAPSPGA